MVKCKNCGLDVADDMENCPNCGNDLKKSDVVEETVNQQNRCSNCGAELNENNSFCPSCGTKVENENPSLKCSNCGSDLPENTLFCSVCGTKVANVKKEISQAKTCPNCGVEVVENGITFCPECGSNIFTGEKNKHEMVQVNSIADKINLNSIIKPAIAALILSIILSLIGLLIGFSWVSFIIAIILTAGLFGAAIDNDANSIIFGLIVGLILGLLENPLVEFMYGAFVAGVYDWVLGGHLVLIVILGIVMAYVSNVYLKESILNMTDNFKGML